MSQIVFYCSTNINIAIKFCFILNKSENMVLKCITPKPYFFRLKLKSKKGEKIFAFYKKAYLYFDTHQSLFQKIMILHFDVQSCPYHQYIR